MKIGISLGLVNPKLWVQLTEEADRLGYESVWLPEHLVLPVDLSGTNYPGTESGTPPIPPNAVIHDVFSATGFLAGRTGSIRLSQNVFNVGLRHPFTTARAVTTLDVLSGGRIDLGVGASWLKAEWDAVGLDFATRGRRVDEALEIIRRLWTEEVVSFCGDHFSFPEVMFEPKPVQKPHPKIHVGGDSMPALRRAARLGDGWIPMTTSFEELPAQIAKLAQLRAESGRDGRVEVTYSGPVESRSDLDRYADVGVDRLLVRPWRRSSEAVDGLRRFADEVLNAG